MQARKKNEQEAGKRGRPMTRGVVPYQVLGSATTFRSQFGIAWTTLGPKLLAAKSEEEVTNAVLQEGAVSASTVPRLSKLILEVVGSEKFPDRPKSQYRFLADSLAAGGLVSPRRSRDICGEERSKRLYVIVRREYYIECSCGYTGIARHGGCQNCGTGELSQELMERELSY